MIKKEDVERIWDEEDLPDHVRSHSRAVELLAMRMVKGLRTKGIDVDEHTIRMGALLHDIGRSVTHDIDHGVEGGAILRKRKLEKYALIAERHVGSGLSRAQARQFGLPDNDYLPHTLEEKIICYADCCVDHEFPVFYNVKVREWEKEFGKDSETVKRLKLLHAEIENAETVEEAYAEEKEAIEKGEAILNLMKKAGRNVARKVADLAFVEDREVCVFCGTGNNGGDGLVAARYLKEKYGANVDVLFFGDAPKTEEAKENFKKVEEAGIKITKITKDVKGHVTCSVAIDAMLGAGTKGQIKEPIASGIRLFNSTTAYKVSIDVPTGMNPDTGEESELCIKPDKVLCIHSFKKGLVGKFKVGDVLVLDIGVPHTHEIVQF